MFGRVTEDKHQQTILKNQRAKPANQKIGPERNCGGPESHPRCLQPLIAEAYTSDGRLQGRARDILRDGVELLQAQHLTLWCSGLHLETWHCSSFGLTLSGSRWQPRELQRLCIPPTQLDGFLEYFRPRQFRWWIWKEHNEQKELSDDAIHSMD